jgi:hypothetical protein
MSHFNFNLNDLTSDNMVQSYIGNSSNYTPEGKAMGLTTSMSSDPSPQKALTTFSVSDIMQGAATYKPQGLVYNSFNNSLSKDLSKVRNTKIGNSNIQMSKAQMGLMGYDTKNGIGYNLEAMGANASAALSGATSGGTVSSGGSPVNVHITKGTPPDGIPKGPLQPRFLRDSRRGGAPASNVEIITVEPMKIVELLAAAGCDPSGIMFLWALAKRESSFNCNTAGINNNGSTDCGLWQINNGKPDDGTKGYDGWRGNSIEWICDPWVNVGIAMLISNNGTNFIPWQLSGNYSTADGSHLRGVKMDEAEQFFRDNKLI